MKQPLSTEKHTSPPSHGCWLLVFAIGFLGCGDGSTPVTETPEEPSVEAVSHEGQTEKEPASTEEKRTETSEAGHVNLLIDAKSLQSRLADSNLRLLDVRPPAAYEAGHLPGAVHLDATHWKDVSLGDGGLENTEAWADIVSPLGIDRQKTDVVVYGDGASDATTVTRIWWLLRYLGVAHVAVLDGGLGAIEAIDEKVATEDVPTIEAVPFEPDFQADRLVRISELKGTLGKEDKFVVVDTRSDDEYEGKVGLGGRGGHIPGAEHIEWKDLLREDGTFKPKEELRAIFEKTHGITPEQTAVMHCQTGGRAALNVLAMELAGYQHVRNYYCGWKEWSADKDTPVETPSSP